MYGMVSGGAHKEWVAARYCQNNAIVVRSGSESEYWGSDPTHAAHDR